MARKLKVFQAQFGFFDSVVAAPSQAAALRAWDAHQNLFSDGHARLSADDDAIAAALAQPEVPLRRAVGSPDPFSLTPRLPMLPDGPQTTPKPSTRHSPGTQPARKPAVKPERKRASPPIPPPDRSRLERAESALTTLLAARRTEEETFRTRRADLEAAEQAAATRFAEAHARAQDHLKTEQEAFARRSNRCVPSD